MLEIIVIISLLIASIWDLKTTEIPDEIPLFLIFLAIFIGIFSQDFDFLKRSLIFGSIFSLIGFIMYYTGQWGGGDSFILASIAFLYPSIDFLVKFLLNLIIFGAAFMIIFTIVYCYIFSRKVFFVFYRELKKEYKIYLIIFLATLLIFLSFSIYFGKFYSSAFLNSIIITSLFLVFKFSRIAEKIGFRKRIKISELKVGDVPVFFKRWRGITESEIKELKKKNIKFIEIKEGVRFIPAFLIAFVYTIIFGKAFLLPI